MKILIYSHFYKPEAGAASVRIQYLVEAIKKAGYEFLIISPYPNYPHRNLFKNLISALLIKTSWFRSFSN